MIFNEDTRVKIPCILHLVTIGYQYLSLKKASWDEDTNIFPLIFQESARINPGNDIEFTNLAIPDPTLVKKFTAIFESAFERRDNNIRENQHLTQLRDWLLPMLMNSQVRVA